MVFWVEMNLLVERSQWAMMHGDFGRGFVLRYSDAFLAGGAVTNWGCVNGPLQGTGSKSPETQPEGDGWIRV